MTEMTTADEANNTLILYLSPQLHHLPSTSAVPDADIISNMSLQLSVQPVSCSGLPASSEPLQSYVVSPITSAVEDGLSHADDAVSASTTRQLDVTAECVEDVVEHHPIDCDGSGFVQNVMTVEPTEAAVSRDQNVGQSKVSTSVSVLCANCSTPQTHKCSVCVLPVSCLIFLLICFFLQTQQMHMDLLLHSVARSLETNEQKPSLKQAQKSLTLIVYTGAAYAFSFDCKLTSDTKHGPHPEKRVEQYFVKNLTNSDAFL